MNEECCKEIIISIYASCECNSCFTEREKIKLKNHIEETKDNYTNGE